MHYLWATPKLDDTRLRKLLSKLHNTSYAEGSSLTIEAMRTGTVTVRVLMQCRSTRLWSGSRATRKLRPPAWNTRLNFRFADDSVRIRLQLQGRFLSRVSLRR